VEIRRPTKPDDTGKKKGRHTPTQPAAYTNLDTPNQTAKQVTEIY
jgi:hypothetical protein